MLSFKRIPGITILEKKNHNYRYIGVKVINLHLLVKVLAIPVIPFRSRDNRFYRYISVNFTFGLLYCNRYIGDIVTLWIVKPGFCSKHYTVTLPGLKNVNRYIGNIVLLKIVILRFHCSPFYSCVLIDLAFEWK